VVVGRDGELDRLRRAVHGAARGEPGCVFVVGEAGVGKSRLLAATRDEAERSGVAVCSGRASITGPIAYGVIAQALRSWLRAHPPEAGDLAPFSPGLKLVLPEWEVMRPSTVLSDAQLRLLALEGVLRLLEHVARNAGGAIVLVDDLHDADGESLEAIRYVVGAAPSGVAVVGAARPGPSALADQVVRELERDGAADVWHLPPLERREVGDLLAALLDGAPPPELVDDVTRRTDGVPLLVEEVLDAHLRAGSIAVDDRGVHWRGGVAAVPQTVTDLVQARLEPLGAAGVEVLTAGAIAGELDLALLASMTDRPSDAIERAITGAVDAGLLEADRGVIDFRHAVLREAVLELTLPHTRQVMHRRAHDALAERPDDISTLERRAHHLEHAGADDEAARLLVLAARGSADDHALLAGERLARRALHLAQSPEARENASDELARVLSRQGRWSDALTLDEDAARRYPDRRSRRLRMARCALESGRHDAAAELITQAIERGDESPAVHALASRLALDAENPDEALAAARRAVAASETGDAEARCEALDALGRALDLAGRRDDAATAFTRQAEVAEEAGLGGEWLRALVSLGTLELLDGRPPDHLFQARDLARRDGAFVEQAWAELNLGYALIFGGRPGEAEQVTREAVAQARELRLDVLPYLLVVNAFAASYLDHDAAEPLLAEAESIADTDDLRVHTGNIRGDLGLRAGRFADAADEFRRGAEAMRAVPGSAPGDSPCWLVWALAATGQVDAARRALDEARAMPDLERLYGRRTVLDTAEAALAGSAERVDAALADAAPGPELDRALMRVLAARVVPGPDAARWLRDAFEIYDQAGAHADAARVRGLLRDAGAPVALPCRPRRSQRRPRPHEQGRAALPRRDESPVRAGRRWPVECVGLSTPGWVVGFVEFGEEHAHAERADVATAAVPAPEDPRRARDLSVLVRGVGEERAVPPRGLAPQPAHRTARDAHLHRTGVERRGRVGTERRNRVRVDAAVRAPPTGEREQRVLVRGLAHHVDLDLARQRHLRGRPVGQLGDTGASATRVRLAQRAAQRADAALATAAEAHPAAAVGVDVQRRVVVVVERAEVRVVTRRQHQPRSGPRRRELGLFLLGARGHAGPVTGPGERARLRARERAQPRRGRQERDLVRRASGPPPVPAAARVHARGRHGHAAFGLDVAARRDRSARQPLAPARGEPQVPAATAGDRLDRGPAHTPRALELGERFLSAVATIDVEHDDARDATGDDPDVRVGPAPPPRLHLRRARPGLLEPLPAHARMLRGRRAANAPTRTPAVDDGVHGNHRPPARRVGERGPSDGGRAHHRLSGADAHALAVVRDDRVPTQVATQSRGERCTRARFTVHDERGRRRPGRAAEPRDEPVAVGMRRERVGDDDLRAHRHVPAQHLDRGHAVREQAASRALGLIPGEHHRVAGVREQARQMVEHAPAGRHARRRDDDRRRPQRVEGDRLVTGPSFVQRPAVERSKIGRGQAYVGIPGRDRVPVHVEDLERHRAVGVHGQVRDAPGLDELPQREHHDLGAVDGERRDDDRAAPFRGASDGGREALDHFVGRFVDAVAVRRLDEERVHFRRRGRRAQDRVVRPSDVAAHEHARRRAGVDLEHHPGRSEDVARGPERRAHTGGGVERRVEVGGHELGDAPRGVGFGVQRLGRVVLGEAVPIGVVGLLLLEPGRVGEHDLAELRGAVGHEHRAREPLAREHRHVPDVVEMGMGDDDGVDRRRIDRKRLAVAEPEALDALEQPGVDQHARPAGVEQELAAGDRAGRAQERQHGGDGVHRGRSATSSRRPFSELGRR
jgi:tetratricopeptide (TPR) repeat protein